jgi:hypothetical protein
MGNLAAVRLLAFLSMPLGDPGQHAQINLQSAGSSMGATSRGGEDQVFPAAPAETKPASLRFGSRSASPIPAIPEPDPSLPDELACLDIALWTAGPAEANPDPEAHIDSNVAPSDDARIVKMPDSVVLPLSTPNPNPVAVERGFQWGKAFNQSSLFLGIQHAFRFGFESTTRTELKGPFFRDYFATVKSLRGWRDGDSFFTNYIGHPMQGAITGFIYTHNDPAARRLEVRMNKQYWMSRFKAAAWSAAYSLQFELGLVGEAALGNVGRKPAKGSNHPMAYVDLVVTPVLGAAWRVGEDLLDQYVIRRIEDKTNNRLVRILARCFLNPSRTVANFLRREEVWYRDDRYLRGGQRP